MKRDPEASLTVVPRIVAGGTQVELWASQGPGGAKTPLPFTRLDAQGAENLSYMLRGAALTMEAMPARREPRRKGHLTLVWSVQHA